jgi:hypothetical protein
MYRCGTLAASAVIYRHGGLTVQRLSRQLLAASVLILALVITTDGPANAAVVASCHGITCESFKTTDKGCTDDAYIVHGVQEGGVVPDGNVTVDLYYSPTCHAAWGEYNTPSLADPSLVKLFSQPYSGGDLAVKFTWPAIQFHNTLTTMVNWDDSMRFCVAHGGGELIACTEWR